MLTPPMELWDVHTHCFSRAYLALLEQYGGDYRIERTGTGHPRVTWRGWSVVTLHPATYDVTARFEDPRQRAVRVHVISTTVPNLYPLPEAVQSRAARVVNDELARWRDAYPDRMRGLASLPMDSDDAVAEVDRALDALGLSGFILGTHIGRRDLDDAAFAPIFARLDERKARVLLHPMVPEWAGERLAKHDLLSLVGFINAITECVTRLTLTGFFRRYPHIRFILPQMGGASLWVRGRVRFGWPETADPSFQEPTELYYDTLSFQPEALAAAARLVGPDRLMFGSDYPHLGDAAAVWQDVQAAELGAAAEYAVARGNALRLFSER